MENRDMQQKIMVIEELLHRSKIRVLEEDKEEGNDDVEND